MAEVDKLTLEIEDKASQSTNGIDTLINKLQKLDTTVNTSVSKLNRLSNSFTKLESATRGLRNINFNNLNNSIGQLSTAFNKIERATKNFESTAQSIKTMSSAMNSLMRSLNKMSTGQANMGNIDLSGLTSQSDNIAKLGTMSQSLLQLKDGAKSINTLVRSLENLNKLDFKTTQKSMSQLITLLNSVTTASNNFVTSSQNLKLMASAMNSLNKALTKLNTTQNSSKLNLNNLNFQVNQYAKGMTKGSNFAGATDLLSMTTLLRQAADGFAYLLKASNDYIETMNLFSVVMGENTEQAWNFIQALESIGVNQEQAMRFQSSFYDIGKSLGMTSQNAYTLSEQFTKLAYDYSSLYNMSEEDTFQKLQAAIVGTTEPIRRLGKDISIAKLEEVALSLGIKESVRNMTQAEKAELRFIAVMQQSTSAMNDMERTINSPANALRILKAQFTSLARELGNLFIPMLQAVLPWLIAITKFIRGIVADIAGFFGITFNEIDFSGINSQLGQSDTYTGDVADNLGDAADNAKKLKDYMLGIDELNVLNEDTGTIDRNTGAAGAGGAGGGGGLGLDLSDFGYDELLKGINSQADEILKIFEKWKTPLLVVAGILAGLWAVGKIYKFIQALKGVQSTSTILSGVTGLGALAKSFFGLAGTGGILGIAATGFVTLGDTILSTFGIITGSTTVAGLTGLGAVLAAVALAGWGVYKATRPAVEQVDALGEASEKTTSKLEPILDVWESLETEIHKIDWTNKVITDEDIQSINDKVKTMVDGVLNEVDADRNKALQDIELMSGVEGISVETYNDIISQTNSYYDNLKTSTKTAQDEINKILETASSEKRTLKEEEVQRLQELERQIRDNAVTTMSESEEEQLEILTRLKHNEEAITVESASKILTDAKKNYDDQVKEAEDWRTRMLMQLDQRFGDEADMSNSEYAEQYNAIQAAYEQQVGAAKSGYEQINDEVMKGLGDQKKYIDEDTGEIKENWEVWLDDMAEDWNTSWTNVSNWWAGWKADFKQGWNNFWGGLDTWFQGVINGLSDWWGGIKSSFNSWKKSFKEGWDNFWGGLGSYADQFKWNDPSTWISWSSMTVPIDYGVGSVATPEITAFARGGFVPSNASFISPSASLWTAGEAGREVVGNFKGRTTVMPLEDTGFVQAIYQSTREAVISAMNQVSQNGSNTPIEVKVYLDSREIRKANVKQEAVQSNPFVTRR